MPLRTENQAKQVRTVVKNVEKLIFDLETLVFCSNIRENKRQQSAYAGKIAGRRDSGMAKPDLMHTGSSHVPVRPMQAGTVRKTVHEQGQVFTGEQQSRPKTRQSVKNTPDKKSEKIIKMQHEFEMWRVQETERLESKKQNLRRETRQMEQERMQLNIEKAHFHRQQEFEETKKKHEEHLLEMKRQILEGELYKLAEEKKQFEQKKNFYDQVDAYQKDDIRTRPASVHGAMFFAGVNNQSSLKKRYKDLLKIYHPDNKCGDTDAIQEINREYQRLLAQMQEKGQTGKG